MFGSLPPTQFDLNFRLGRTPVTVSVFFWLAAAVLGWGLFVAFRDDRGLALAMLAGWAGVMFVSILLHEFGHVWAFRWCNIDARVLLYHFGGLAIPTSAGRLSLGQQIFVSFAGPLVQFILAGVTFAAMIGFAGGGTLASLPPKVGLFVEVMLGQLLYINIVWALLNLLPIWPLDGGHICRAVCHLLIGDPAAADTWADRIGLGTAVVGGLVAFKFQLFYMVFFAAVLGMPHFQRLQGRTR